MEPQLKSPVAPSLSEVSSSSSTSTVPNVAQAVGKIANYFGSCSPGKVQKEDESKEGIGLGTSDVACSTESAKVKEIFPKNGNAIAPVISESTSGAEDLPEQVADVEKSQEDVKETLNETLPSYAPQKCIAQANYSKNLEPGSNEAQDPKTDMTLTAESDNSDVTRLKEALVTEKDIFGSDHDSDDHEGGSLDSSNTGLEIVEKDEKSIKNDNNGKDEETLTEVIREVHCVTAEKPLRVEEDVIDLVDEEVDVRGASECGVGSPGGSDDPMDWDGNNDFEEMPSDSDCKTGSSSDLLPSASVSSMGGDVADGDGGLNEKGEDEKMEDNGVDDEYSKEDKQIMEEFQKIASMEDISKKACDCSITNNILACC